MAYLAEEAKRCSQCGTATWEWEENKWAYEAATYTCQGCLRLDAAREDFKPGPGTRMILISQEKAQERQSLGN